MTAGTDTHERVNALLALYRESHYDVQMPRGGAATVRVGALAPPTVARWIGGDGVAFYLTSCNPRSTSLPKEENEQRLDALRGELRARGCRWLEGAGHIPGELLARAVPARPRHRRCRSGRHRATLRSEQHRRRAGEVGREAPGLSAGLARDRGRKRGRRMGVTGSRHAVHAHPSSPAKAGTTAAKLGSLPACPR